MSMEALGMIETRGLTAAIEAADAMVKAAAANAFEQAGVKSDALKVSEIFADESVTYKRGKPRAQGRIYRRLKRTSHLTIKVSDAVK